MCVWKGRTKSAQHIHARAQEDRIYYGPKKDRTARASAPLLLLPAGGRSGSRGRTASAASATSSVAARPFAALTQLLWVATRFRFSARASATRRRRVVRSAPAAEGAPAAGVSVGAAGAGIAVRPAVPVIAAAGAETASIPLSCAINISLNDQLSCSRGSGAGSGYARSKLNAMCVTNARDSRVLLRRS